MTNARRSWPALKHFCGQAKRWIDAGFNYPVSAYPYAFVTPIPESKSPISIAISLARKLHVKPRDLGGCSAGLSVKEI
ncbi:hypothetical protein PM082_009565 [Marasmius tenuissimus]|nr:hypothetical protein PM082_009565 [Marasmius tenuissimus]